MPALIRKRREVSIIMKYTYSGLGASLSSPKIGPCEISWIQGRGFGT